MNRNHVYVGASLAAAAILAVVAMAHHPTAAHGSRSGDFVHAAMILLLAVMFWAFAFYSLRRGIERPAVLAGLVAYGLSLVAHFGAAVINGFLVPALAARGHGAVGHDTFLLAWETNQALARLGVYATGVAYLAWSWDLLRRPLPDARASSAMLAAVGLLAGAGPALALLLGDLGMDLRTARMVYAAHTLWAAMIGVQLARARI